MYGDVSQSKKKMMLLWLLLVVVVFVLVVVVVVVVVVVHLLRSQNTFKQSDFYTLIAIRFRWRDEFVNCVFICHSLAAKQFVN